MKDSRANWFIRLSRCLESSRGATLVEAALVLGTFFFIVLMLIDTCRFLSVQATLSKGANDALSAAQKLNALSTDIRGVAQGSNEFTRFQAARSAIESKGLQLPLANSISSSTGGGQTKLISYRVTDNLAQSTPYQSDLLVLFPGSNAVSQTSGAPETISHPTVCPQSATNCPSGVLLQPGDNWSNTLRTQPIVIQMAAEMKPLLPIFPKLIVKGTAAGYVEKLVATENPGITPVIPPVLVCPNNLISSSTRTCICPSAGMDRIVDTCYPGCTGNKVRQGTACVCSSTYDEVAGNCLSKCTGGMTRDTDGFCRCAADEEIIDGECHLKCTGGRVRYATWCNCPKGTDDVAGKCVPACTGSLVRVGPDCVCPNGKVLSGSSCVCPSGLEDIAGSCWNVCKEGTRRYSNFGIPSCEPIPCWGGFVLQGNSCVCPAGTHTANNSDYGMNGKICTADCTGGKVQNPDGYCVDPTPTPTPTATASSIPRTARCPDGQRLRIGRTGEPSFCEDFSCWGGFVVQGNSCGCPGGTHLANNSVYGMNGKICIANCGDNEEENDDGYCLPKPAATVAPTVAATVAPTVAPTSSGCPPGTEPYSNFGIRGCRPIQ